MLEKMKDRLLKISFVIAKIYEEIMNEEAVGDSMQKLKIALECEKKIYTEVPINEYSHYINYFNSLDDIYSRDIFGVMLNSPWLLPHSRIVSYFSYLQEKSAMFTDNKENNSSLLRQNFLENQELFQNITLFYQLYFAKKEEFLDELFVSYLNIVYSFKYAEDAFLSHFAHYDMKLLKKFSFLSNPSIALNESYCVQIASFYERLLDSREILYGEDRELVFVFVSIYLSSLCLSIDSEEIAEKILEQYQGKNYKKCSFYMQNYLDILFEVLQDVNQKRKVLKKQQEELKTLQV